MEHVAKTVKVGNKYYREGVEVEAPKKKAVKQAVTKDVGDSLAQGGMDTIKNKRKNEQLAYKGFMNGKSLVKR